MVIDVNVDDGMLDGVKAMGKFLRMAITEPDISKVPFMIDSSKFEIIEEGLKWTQGKSIVNSISLKVGEEKFIEQAKIVKRFGAAVVIMAFDEKGQAATESEKVRICKRVEPPPRCADLVFGSNPYGAQPYLHDRAPSGVMTHYSADRPGVREVGYVSQNYSSGPYQGGR